MIRKQNKTLLLASELIVTQWDVNCTIKSFGVYGNPELIVTQWDVNKYGFKKWYLRAFELIVTQWDVNNVKISCNQTEQIELIVTQWDVNSNEWKGIVYRKYRINSYIVGCKY